MYPRTQARHRSGVSGWGDRARSAKGVAVGRRATRHHCQQRGHTRRQQRRRTGREVQRQRSDHHRGRADGDGEGRAGRQTARIGGRQGDGRDAGAAGYTGHGAGGRIEAQPVVGQDIGRIGQGLAFGVGEGIDEVAEGHAHGGRLTGVGHSHGGGVGRIDGEHERAGGDRVAGAGDDHPVAACVRELRVSQREGGTGLVGEGAVGVGF